jgi:hypothetical protein
MGSAILKELGISHLTIENEQGTYGFKTLRHRVLLLQFPVWLDK